MTNKIRRQKFYDPDFLVIIPTHNHPETLEYSILSVLQQSFKSFKLVVICDGVTNETKEVTAKFKTNKKLTVLDFPKSARVGEEYRDFVIRNYPSRYITYLGDDDLFFPNHLQLMSLEMQEYDFSHPIPAYVTKDRQVALFAQTNLRDEEWVRWHTEGPPYKNSISLTGVAHSRKIYLSLNQGWSTTPESRWADHFMWTKFFSLNGIRLSTLGCSTTIKSPQQFFNRDERQEHIRYYFNKLSEESFSEFWNTEIGKIKSE